MRVCKDAEPRQGLNVYSADLLVFTSAPLEAASLCHFAPKGAFIQNEDVIYKHLAPNGAKYIRAKREAFAASHLLM
jgi:hypothetical protein